METFFGMMRGGLGDNLADLALHRLHHIRVALEGSKRRRDIGGGLDGKVPSGVIATQTHLPGAGSGGPSASRGARGGAAAFAVMSWRVAVVLVLAGCRGDAEPNERVSARAATPLPPDVARVVEPACLSCHGDPPTSSAPQSLVSVEAWRAPSQSDPSKTNGQLAVERMADGLRPMPPTGGARQDELDVVSEWVARGMPAGNPTNP